jgi:hypothetical protein
MKATAPIRESEPARRAGAAQGLFHDAQENAQRQRLDRRIVFEVITQPLGNRQHPLADRQSRKNVLGQMGGGTRGSFSGDQIDQTNTPLFSAVLLKHQDRVGRSPTPRPLHEAQLKIVAARREVEARS